MHSVSVRAIALLLLLCFCLGCQNKGSKSGSSEEGTSADGSQSKKSKLPIKLDVKTLEGNWIVVMTNQKTDNYVWIIRFSKSADGKWVSEFLDTTRDKNEQEKPQIVSTEVDGDSIRIQFKAGESGFDFVGSFQQGFVRGTIRPNPKDLFLARMLPTDESTLEKFSATGYPPGWDIFEGLMKNKDVKFDDILSTARENKTSPIAQDMFAVLMAGHLQAESEAKVKELVDSYVSAANLWGDRWSGRTELTIAAQLINGRKYTRLGLPHLDVAEKKLQEDKTQAMEMIESFRDAANINLRIEELSSPTSSDGQRAEAFTVLTELLKKQRYNPEILFALATEAERTGKMDLAMDYYSEVVALPMLEAYVIRARAGQPPDATPSDSLKKLWTQKNGGENDEGFAKFVDDVYRKKIDEFLTEIQSKEPAIPAADAGNRTALIELFTGMQCPPCVAADLGLEAAERTYPKNKAIIIRHHQHIPLPDGLVNQDSEERGAFYETGSTPTIAVDGMIVDGRFCSGPMHAAENAYKVLRRVIDQRLTEKTDVTLEMSANVTNGQLQATVVATGIPDDVLPSCRLRMAIVEDHVRTIAPNASNGIRDHEFLVREMLGGAKGIPPRKGELKYSMTMPMSDIQKHVVDYIKQFEAGKRFEFPKEMKPPIQGKLSLVAWVQNDKVPQGTNIKLILQSAMVPVTGELGLETEPEHNHADHTAATTTGKTDKPAEPAKESAKEPAEPATIPDPPALPE